MDATKGQSLMKLYNEDKMSQNNHEDKTQQLRIIHYFISEETFLNVLVSSNRNIIEQASCKN